MTQDKDHFEDYPVLSEIKLSPGEREAIWDSIEQGMKPTHNHKKTRGITMIKTSAAVVAALVLFAGGIEYTAHHTSMNTSPGVTTASHSKTPRSTPRANYASEIALIKRKGYSVTAEKPNAFVQTASGKTLSAWIGVLSASQDGHNLRVFFFLNGNYVGTDAQESLEITSAKAANNGIAVTYPVYRASDSLANPTGTPVTITYTWNGSKVVANKPYPKQFAGNSTATQG